ncbi:MAG: hypothetical protein KC619_33635 [Myxococcales bacterium]|nr:hypothetical protein [Myxococcales bacterium]
MPVTLLFGYALLLSVGIPLAFLLVGPVPERRGLLASSFALGYALAWGGALLLGFLSLAAVSIAMAALATLLALAGLYTWQDERFLARFEARLASTTSREEAIEELRSRIAELAEGQRRDVVAGIELVGFAIQRLVAHEAHEDALVLLTEIHDRLGDRVGADRRHLRMLRVRVLLQLGNVDDAVTVYEAELQGTDRKGSERQSPEVRILGALLAVTGVRRGAPIDPPPRSFMAWNDAIVQLVRAHLAVREGDDASATERLTALASRPYGVATLDLARAVPGPASELARRIVHPSSPYR